MCASKKVGPRSGVAAVEFAFVAPVFFLLVFALIEFGRMLMVQQALTNAAREGCRMAVLATTTSSSDVDTAVRDYIKPVVSKGANQKVRVTCPGSLTNCSSGTKLTVAVEVDYNDVTWIPLAPLGVNPTIRAEQSGQRE